MIARLATIRFTPLILLGIGAGLLIFTALAWTGLHAFGRARTALATMDMQARLGATATSPLLTPGMARNEADRDAAAVAMVAAIRQAAAERHLLVERIALLPPSKATPVEIMVDVTLSGPEADIFRVARVIEASRPAIRFARWRVARTGPAETAIRLDGRAVAYWEPAR